MRERVFNLVKEAVDTLNEELEYDALNDVSEATPVFGGLDGIDSLSLVTLIVSLERAVEECFNQEVVLADEKAMSMANSPYRNVGVLVDFIADRLVV